MKIESFDQAHSGRCPGCGIVDNGNHIGHRYGEIAHAGCIHEGPMNSFHCPDGCKDSKHRHIINKRWQKWLTKELGLDKVP
jgi:hypothetical protein